MSRSRINIFVSPVPRLIGLSGWLALVFLAVWATCFPAYAYRGAGGVYVPTDAPRWTSTRKFPPIALRTGPLSPKDQGFIAMVCGHIEVQAKKRHLPPRFLAKLIWVESRFNPYAISHMAAQGIAQFIPSTAKIWGLDDPFDPPQAIRASARLLSSLKKDLGNLGLAAAGYNAGEKRVGRWLKGTSRLPLETRNYVRAITGIPAHDWTQRPFPKPNFRLGRHRNFQKACQALPINLRIPQVRYAKGHYNQAIDFFNQRWLNRAIARYSTAILLHPKYVKAYYNRAIAYQKRGEYNLAIADYTQAIQLRRNHASAYNNRGLALRRTGMHARALADFSQAIKFNPKYSRAYYNRAVAYQQRGKLGKAIADYSRAIKFRPRYALAFHNRAIAYQRTRKYELAIADYTQAIKFKPKYAAAYDNRGAAFWRLGKLKQAIADYDLAIKLNPERASAFGRRGLAYAKLGLRNKAIADFRRATVLRPGHKLAIAGLKRLGVAQ